MGWGGGGGGGAHPNKYIIIYDIPACFESVSQHSASKLLDSSSQIKSVKSDFIQLGTCRLVESC